MKNRISVGLTALMLFAAAGICGDGGRSVKIGNQIWTAENLNDASKGGICYKNKHSNCEKYGRLYTWDEAMKACPAGWRLPSFEEWRTLTAYVGNNSAPKLKARSGWKNYHDESGNGTDEYGFSALPGGYYRDGALSALTDTYFILEGFEGYWWTASEQGTSAWYRNIGNNGSDGSGSYSDKTSMLSVRCLKK
ncbi:MAG: hypothetical protein FWC26_10970 [Fibromonadales bacterium]|nr:hypothetical protein [Fibromonadales bacterium]